MPGRLETHVPVEFILTKDDLPGADMIKLPLTHPEL